MSDTLNNPQIIDEQESSIDFGKIFKDLLKHKRLYFIVLPLAFVLAAIYALSLPNFYTATVKLAPEMGANARAASGLSGLAGSLGLGGVSAGSEALTPTLYPDLMNSVDFKTSLFSIKVKRDGENREYTYYDYLMNEQKGPWWASAKSAFFSLFRPQASSNEKPKEEKVDPFKLTMAQTGIVGAINAKVICSVDKMTQVITIQVTDQDPLICATVADSVKTRLQKFITDYRTSKVRVDLEYSKKLYQEAKERYEKARQRYASFSDANQDVILQSVQTKLNDLENDMQLQYNIYQQVVSNLQQAEMKVQEETPAFTTLQSATVPVRKAGPKRAQMCLIFVFLAFLGTTVWILFKEEDLKPLLGLG